MHCVMDWYKVFRINLRTWDVEIQSDFFYTLAPSVAEAMLQIEEGGWDLDEVKGVEEVDEMLILLPG